MVSTPTRRRDARRNRERLVTAARELVAVEGSDVAVREVARRAGVGMGTLYRHFPAKEDLLDAVLADAFEELVGVAEAARDEPDAWRGFRRFVEESLVLHARNRGLKDVFETHAHGRDRAEAMRRRLRPLVEQIVRRAQEQGALRPDFAPEDVRLVFWGAARILELGGEVAPELWRRQLGFVLDGLRAEAATPLLRRALSRAELSRLEAQRR